MLICVLSVHFHGVADKNANIGWHISKLSVLVRIQETNSRSIALLLQKLCYHLHQVRGVIEDNAMIFTLFIKRISALGKAALLRSCNRF